ncbi:MAG: hypothetical protein JTJ23_03030 [Fusicatenibacter saccharivorans]|jgi:hypothetical protein|uniref:Uncharacterized protein n=1 Tax=Fusicatenibacter saccharivorans TaxID=1150298 RepID=A0A938ZCE3_9FIRM|nr:hypothetical protein [Fusicatenibacter saccharivorans]DAQ72220.1 MAG TPA: bZIP factor protein [Caudoviricetes sp.]
MLKARKANRVVRIPDEKKDVYIKLGYTITDMDDNIVHEHVEPTQRLKDLEAENETLKVENETLKAENETLKVENAAMKEKKSQNETASEPAEEKAPAKKSTKAAAK